MEKKYPNVNFFKISLEENEELLKEPEFNNIRAVPTVKFARIMKTSTGKVLQLSDEEFKGSDAGKLGKVIDGLLS